MAKSDLILRVVAATVGEDVTIALYKLKKTEPENKDFSERET